MATSSGIDVMPPTISRWLQAGTFGTLRRERFDHGKTSTSADVAVEIAALAAEKQCLVEATTAANTDDEHDPEGATIAFERAQADGLRGHAERRLIDLDDSLTAWTSARTDVARVAGRRSPMSGPRHVRRLAHTFVALGAVAERRWAVRCGAGLAWLMHAVATSMTEAVFEGIGARQRLGGRGLRRRGCAG
jgi:hypothetical protein